MIKQAIANRVWFEPIIEEPVTESGIILNPLMEKPKPTKGKVLFIGKYCDLELIGDLRVGDVILFEKHHPHVEEVDGETHYTILDRNIIATLPDWPNQA